MASTTFQDQSGREWTLALDGPTIATIRSDCDDPRFLKGNPIETLTRLGEDPVLLCSVLHVLCRKQIADRQLSVEDFYAGVVGDAIEAAGNALEAAILAFIPRCTREVAKVCGEKDRLINETAHRRLLAKIDDPDLVERYVAAREAELDAELRNLVTPSTSAAATPASAASPPTA